MDQTQAQTLHSCPATRIALRTVAASLIAIALVATGFLMTDTTNAQAAVLGGLTGLPAVLLAWTIMSRLRHVAGSTLAFGLLLASSSRLMISGVFAAIVFMVVNNASDTPLPMISYSVGFLIVSFAALAAETHAIIVTLNALPRDRALPHAEVHNAC